MSISLSRLPFDMIFTIVSSPIHSQPLPKKVDTSSPESGMRWDKLNFVTKDKITLLDEAHKLLEQAISVKRLSLVCLSFRNASYYALDRMKNKIAANIHLIFEKENGADCFSECMDTGSYLSVLKIYYSVHPQSLKNFAENANGLKRNILHDVVHPNNIRVYSPSFVKFILEMDQQYKLNLLDAFDYAGLLPIHRMCSHYNSGVPYQNLLALNNVGLLKRYANVLSRGSHEIPPLPPLPPLYFLVNSNDTKAMQLLIEKGGANANWTDEAGNTILHVWIQRDGKIPLTPECIRELCKFISPATLASCNKAGQTALDLVIQNFRGRNANLPLVSNIIQENFLKIIQILLEADAKASQTSMDKLINTVINDYPEEDEDNLVSDVNQKDYLKIIVKLFDAGAKASQESLDKLLDITIKNCPEKNEKNLFSGVNLQNYLGVIEMLVQANAKASEETMDQLLDIVINDYPKRNKNDLYSDFNQENYLEIIATLFEAGARASEETMDQLLDIAIKNCPKDIKHDVFCIFNRGIYLKVIEMLVQAGAKASKEAMDKIADIS